MRTNDVMDAAATCKHFSAALASTTRSGRMPAAAARVGCHFRSLRQTVSSSAAWRRCCRISSRGQESARKTTLCVAAAGRVGHPTVKAIFRPGSSPSSTCGGATVDSTKQYWKRFVGIQSSAMAFQGWRGIGVRFMPDRCAPTDAGRGCPLENSRTRKLLNESKGPGRVVILRLTPCHPFPNGSGLRVGKGAAPREFRCEIILNRD